MHKVSCLVCVHSQDHNTDDMLIHGLKTVINQTRPVDEIVIVLDECWDRTIVWLHDNFRDYIQLLQKPYMILFHKSRKEGLAAAKNYGLKHCGGDWITFLDADDAWMLCKNEVQSQFIENYPLGLDFVGTLSWDRWPTKDAPINEWILKPSCFEPGQYQTQREITLRLPYENVMCHGSMMIRADALRELGGYQDVRGAEDWQLWQRAVAAGYKFYTIPERLYIWSHGTSVER